MSKIPLKIAVFCNALETLNPKKDSTLAVMLAAQTLGHEIFTASISTLSANEMGVSANFSEIHLQ